MRTENKAKTAMISLLTVVYFSTLIGCRISFQQNVLCIHSPHHSQLVLTWVITSHGRHNLPRKIGMHHQHVVAGLWSCSIPVAQWDREAGEGEGSQEEQADSHLGHYSVNEGQKWKKKSNKKNRNCCLSFWLSQCYKGAVVLIVFNVMLMTFYLKFIQQVPH